MDGPGSVIFLSHFAKIHCFDRFFKWAGKPECDRGVVTGVRHLEVSGFQPFLELFQDRIRIHSCFGLKDESQVVRGCRRGLGKTTRRA